MRVTLWDMDWFYKKSFVPNHRVQKLSSYHKQKGDIVYRADTQDHLDFDYDLMYIIRESARSPMPDIKYIDNPKVRLVGPEFKYYSNNYTIPIVVDMVRPDYRIYPLSDNNLYKDASILQMFRGITPLPKRQPHENVAFRDAAKTIVVDEHMWKATDENIISVLKDLKQYKNIMFLHRISLKRLIDNELVMENFLKLDLAAHNRLRFRNDVGSDFESVKKAIDFYKQMKAIRGRMEILPIPVRAVMLDHNQNREFYFEDLKRCLMIVDYAKQEGVHVILRTPELRSETPFWFIFDVLEVWTTSFFGMSYIESMLSSRTQRTNETWHEVLANREKWSTPRSQFLVTLMAKDFEFFEEYGTRQWKERKISLQFIDRKYIEESVYGKNNEFKIINNLQEEMK